MAVFRCAVFIFPPPRFPGGRVSFKAIQCSSASPPFPSKLSRRKNYLRPKILKTLKPKPSETSFIEIETPQSSPPSNESSDQFGGEGELSSVVSEELNGMSGKLTPKSLAKYGLYLVGVFVFQTVCAVWFLGSSTNSGQRAEISNDSVSSSRRLLLNGSGESSNERNGLNPSNVIYLEELEMNEKIAEIRAMAREARKSEQKGGKSDNDDTVSTSERLDIEKEIGARLSNMEKRLNSQRKGFAGLRVEPLDEFDNGEGKRSNLDVEGNEKSLMFEKKYKFKAEKRLSDVKGFGGGGRGNRGSNSGTKETDTGESGLSEKVNDLVNDEKISAEMQKEKEAADPEIVSGAVQETDQRRSSNVAKRSRNSLSSQGNGKLVRNNGEKQSGKENGLWWLKLRYVLRILMRSDIDEEVSEGFFTLRTNSKVEGAPEISHMVAFEDQNDARNFCHLLESVFEDLGGFTAGVIPISTKDLHSEVSSSGKKVIVVKKQQLTLYAGQPFDDVERALRSLIREQ